MARVQGVLQGSSSQPHLGCDVINMFPRRGTTGSMGGVEKLTTDRAGNEDQTGRTVIVVQLSSSLNLGSFCNSKGRVVHFHLFHVDINGGDPSNFTDKSKYTVVAVQ